MAAPRAIPQRREVTDDSSLGRVDQAREELANALRNCPFLRGRLVSVDFPTGGARKVVRHGLGVAAACIIVRQNYETVTATYASIIEYQNEGVDLTQNLALISDVTSRVDLWFYPRSSKPIDAAQGQSL